MINKPTKHSGDCHFYSSTHNQQPTDGICTCGYGLHLLRTESIYSQLVSVERMKYESEETDTEVSDA